MATIQLALVVVVVLGITFQSCRTQQQGVCYQSITHQRSYSTYVRQSYETYYQCWWSRCSRTRYRQQHVTRYQTEYSSQFYCCAGYQPCDSDSTCCPICSPSCEEWEVCTAPDTCDCPTGYSGSMCADPLCTNCYSNHTCIAAEMCVCPTGWTGSDCHTDINECEENVAHCHHSCTNLDGGYICTCEIGYALSNDLQSCLGSPRNVTLTGITSTTLLLRWEPPEEDPGSGTILQYSITCRFGDGDSLPQHRLSVLNQSLQLMDLRPFTSYNCCVSAQKSNGNSLDSCSSQTTSEDVPGDFPENLIMTNRSSHAVLIEWSPPNEPNGIVTGYTLYVNYDNDTSEPERVLMTDGSTSRYTLENLLAFQLVSVQMTANTSAGEGPRSGSVEARTNPTAPSSAPRNIAVDLQTPSFSWSPPPLLDQNGVITKYTVRIVEVESGRRIQQLDVNSTTTSVALPDLTLTPCYTYQFSVTAYTVEYGPSAMLDVKTISGNSTALLCFRLVNEELEMEDIDEFSQIISTQVIPNTMQARNISYIKFTNISTHTDGGSETALVVFLQFGTGAASRDTEEALGCWLAETSSIDVNGISLHVMDPPTCLPNYEETDCLKLQRSTDNCDEAQHTGASTSDRDVILSVFGGLLAALILLSLLVVGVIALVIRARKNSKQEFTPPMESERILHNPLYGEKPKSYVDNPTYNIIPKSEQLAAEMLNKDETTYMYVDPKSSHSHELVEVPPAVPCYSESNQHMHGGNKQLEPEYASLKPTTAVYENIGHPDSQIVQEEFYST